MTFAGASTIVMAAILGPTHIEAQVPDSSIVVDVHHQADSAFTLVLQAFAKADIEIAVASTEQGLVVSQTEKMGRDSQIAFARFQAQLIGMGPITQVVLSGVLSPTENLENQETVTSRSFFHGALVWARLQWVGRELRRTSKTASDR